MRQVALSYQYWLRQNKSEYYVRKGLEKYVPGCICIFWDIDLIKNPAYVWVGVEYYCDKLLCHTDMMIQQPSICFKGSGEQYGNAALASYNVWPKQKTAIVYE